MDFDATIGWGKTINPPSYVVRAVEQGVAWAESVVERRCKLESVSAWPSWPPWERARAAARTHAQRLVAELDQPRPLRACVERAELARAALERLCYEAARARYLELAAWRER